MTRFPVPPGWSANRPRDRTAGLLAGVLLVLWAAIVAVTASHHEFWRDEINAFTLALRASSQFTVPATVHSEGHPGVWYMLLRAAHDVFGTKAVLPVVAAAIAGIAVILFLWRAPFPVWQNTPGGALPGAAGNPALPCGDGRAQDVPGHRKTGHNQNSPHPSITMKARGVF